MASRTINPLLCKGCQKWDNVDFFNEKPVWFFRPSATLDQLAANPLCMVCTIVKSSVESRLPTVGVSDLTVRIDDPQPICPVLDLSSKGKTSMLSQVSISDSTEIEVRVLLFLGVQVYSKLQTSASKINEPTCFWVQPQVLFVYSKSNSHLVSVQPWETPFFDIALLREWVRGCADLHGEQCRKNLKVSLSQ
jgi:hypothetical protein